MTYQNSSDYKETAVQYYLVEDKTKIIIYYMRFLTNILQIPSKIILVC